MSDRLYELMTLQDVAQRLKMSTDAVMQRMIDGSLPAPLKLGRHLRWDRTSIEEWIASHAGERPASG
jgi:excisionase family DNA binding protein